MFAIWKPLAAREIFWLSRSTATVPSDEIKGPLRPIVPEAERCELVAALQCVDYVCLFETPDPLPLIKLLQPDILVKGADWSLDKTVGAEEVQRTGGRVVHVQLVPEASTTKIIERILDRFQEKNETTDSTT